MLLQKGVDPDPSFWKLSAYVRPNRCISRLRCGWCCPGGRPGRGPVRGNKLSVSHSTGKQQVTKSAAKALQSRSGLKRMHTSWLPAELDHELLKEFRSVTFPQTQARVVCLDLCLGSNGTGFTSLFSGQRWQSNGSRSYCISSAPESKQLTTCFYGDRPRPE